MNAKAVLTSHPYKTVVITFLAILLLTSFSVMSPALSQTKDSTCQGPCCESSDMQCCAQGAMGCCYSREPIEGESGNFTSVILWSYTDYASGLNRTAHLFVVTVEGSLQFYRLIYLVHHVDYNLTVSTWIIPLNAEIYNSSFTFIGYASTIDSEITSTDVVVFNSSVILSGHYEVIAKAAKEFGKSYEKSGNETLAHLAEHYYTMGEEAKYLSKLVEKQLPEYDRKILESSAILVDAYELCSVCSVACQLAIVGGCVAVCLAYPPICYYCAQLVYYVLVLKLGCYTACVLVGLCPPPGGGGGCHGGGGC